MSKPETGRLARIGWAADPAVTAIARRMLADEPCEIIAFESNAELLEAAGAASFDIAILRAAAAGVGPNEARARLELINPAIVTGLCSGASGLELQMARVSPESFAAYLRLPFRRGPDLQFFMGLLMGAWSQRSGNAR
jgi:hypothetical protein